ncbi:MAG: polyamine aminopropyltransferase [Pseudobacteriovorax sp.]|nr:polyamine aminopropyltransferase [Pseudobacteriovorax sp.]
MLSFVSLEKRLLICIFFTGFSGIVAEYVMATMASYLVGDSITQWALTISVMLFFMGIGSQLSQKFKGDPVKAFVACELTLSLLISLAPTIVYALTPYTEQTGVIIYLLSSLLGLLIGAEIPIASQILSRTMPIKKNVAWVLSQDYFGALLGGLAFIYIGQPVLGLTKTAAILGAINFIMALSLISSKRQLALPSLILLICLGNISYADRIVEYGEQSKYKDLIVYSDQSRYQKIVLTQWKQDYWLYLNHNEQFSTVDEHRYHESLVHPIMSVANRPKNILILGGGDGLAARELVKYHEDITSITIVDLDEKVTQLAQTHPVMLAINEEAMLHDKVRIINTDAYRFAETVEETYDAIIIDLPDPKSVSIARMYTVEFYRTLAKSLRPDGCLVTQALSPFFVPQAFWSIQLSMEEAGMNTLPYHLTMPTLGEWGFVLGCPTINLQEISNRFLMTTIDNRFEFLERDQLVAMSVFPRETRNYKQKSEFSNLRNLKIYSYYKNGRWDLY